MKVQEYLDKAKTKKHRYVKKFYLPNQYLPTPDIARIRKDMKIDVFRNNQIYLSIWPRDNGRIWVLTYDVANPLAEPSVSDSLDPVDFDSHSEMIETMISRNEFCCWVDLSTIRDEIYAIQMARIM